MTLNGVLSIYRGVDLNWIWHFSEDFRGDAGEQWQDALRPTDGFSAVEHVHPDCRAVRRRSAGADAVLRRALSGHGIRAVDLPRESTRVAIAMSPACSNSTTTMCSMSYAPSREKQSNSNLREREGQRRVGDLAALRPPYWRSRPRGSFASHLEADFRTASRRGPVLNVPAGHVVCCQVRSGLSPGRWIRTLGPPWRDPIFKSAHQ
jgi:hypothetical protein